MDVLVRPLAELVDGWRGRAREVLGSDPIAWVETLAGRNDLPLLQAGDLADEMLAEAAKVAVHTVAEKRATFARSNVFAEVLRQFHGDRFAAADDRMALVERTSGLAVGEALLISPPELAHTPVAFQRADGTSRFRPRGSEIYTTRDLLDAGRHRSLGVGPAHHAGPDGYSDTKRLWTWRVPGLRHRGMREPFSFGVVEPSREAQRESWRGRPPGSCVAQGAGGSSRAPAR